MSHTPGPWTYENNPYPDDDPISAGWPYITIKAGDGAFRGGFTLNAIIEEDDGRLIAAAPDLLGALQSLGVDPQRDFCFCRTTSQAESGHTGECREARAAITKATGQVLR